MTDTETTAVPSAGDAYIAALRKCTPKQRKWLKALPTYDFGNYAAADALGLSHHTIHRWLRLDKVMEARAAIEQQNLVALGLSHRKVLTEFDRIGHAKLRDFYDEKDLLKPPSKWTDAMSAAVKEYGFDASGKPYIKLHEKGAALTALAKYQRLFPERIEVTGAGGGPLSMTPPVIHIVERPD